MARSGPPPSGGRKAILDTLNVESPRSLVIKKSVISVIGHDQLIIYLKYYDFNVLNISELEKLSIQKIESNRNRTKHVVLVDDPTG